MEVEVHVDLLTSAAEAVSNEGVRLAVLMAAFVTGLRHGFDLDHVIAITDITSAHTDRKRSFASASAYAVGHGLVLLALGLVAVLVGARLPASVDSLMSRVVGFTLIVLGAYVLYSLPRLRRGVRPRSRATLVLGASRRVIDLIRRREPLQHLEIEHEHEHHSEGHGHHHEERSSRGTGSASVAVATKTHTHPHRHVLSVPPDPFSEYSFLSSFLVGMIHGVGAETPSQVLILVTAAGIAGSLAGILVVLSFVAGLFLGNSLLAIVINAGFGRGSEIPILYTALLAGTGVISIYIGMLYVVD